MPLLDHFHAPLDPRRAWESFHSRWANSIADQLNETLPRRFFAEVQIHLGTQVEADVAEFESSSGFDEPADDNGSGGVAVQAWAPPAATLTMPAVFPDDIEVHVRDERDDARLVAVVELVSPRNKDRPDSRAAFAAKTAAYLQRGVGLIILSTRLSMPPTPCFTRCLSPVRRGQNDQIDAWPVVLSVGSTLPVMPLALRASHTIPLDLRHGRMTTPAAAVRL